MINVQFKYKISLSIKLCSSPLYQPYMVRVRVPPPSAQQPPVEYCDDTLDLTEKRHCKPVTEC